MECVDDGEWIGRGRERCTAMRMDFERKNENGLCGRWRMDWKRMRERCIAMRMDFERKNGNGMDGVCRSDY